MVGRMRRRWVALAVFLLFLLPAGAFALNDSVARTPPMGFSTWNYFGCTGITQGNVLAVANAMTLVHAPNWEGKQISLKSAGYSYINLDDCWQAAGRNANGSPTWNTTKFPNGFPWLVDTIHAMGLKIGIYSDAGLETCQKFFGTTGHDSIDACTYQAWGFDYLKFDWCNVTHADSNQIACDSLYSSMGHWLIKADSLAYLADTAANKQHHRIVFSICDWGTYSPWLWGDTDGNLWRTTLDINTSWGSIYGNWNQNIALYSYAGPGGWNDPDMLEIGNLGTSTLATTRSQSHMDMWCICAAPLLMGNDIITMTAATFTVLSNREVIAVDQDSLGYQGRRIRTAGNVQVVVKKLLVHNPDTVDNKKYAVVILNNDSTAAAAGSIKWSDLGITDTSKQFRVRNLWLHRWLKSRSITDTATPGNADTTTLITDSLYITSIPADGTVHVLMEMGNPDSVPSVTSVRPQDNAAVAARMSVRGNAIYIPVARGTVQVFDMQGRQIASVSASQPGWYTVAGRGMVRGGTYLVRLATSAGSVSRVMAFVK